MQLMLMPGLEPTERAIQLLLLAGSEPTGKEPFSGPVGAHWKRAILNAGRFEVYACNAGRFGANSKRTIQLMLLRWLVYSPLEKSHLANAYNAGWFEAKRAS